MSKKNGLPRNLYYLPDGSIRVSIQAYYHSTGKMKLFYLGSYEKKDIHLAIEVRDLIKAMQGPNIHTKRKIHISKLEEARERFRAKHGLTKFYKNK